MYQLKLLIAKVLCHPIVGGSIGLLTGNKITKFGVHFRLESPFIGNRIKALLFWGLYESGEIRFVKKHLSGNYPVVELGASIGIVSAVIGKKIGPQILLSVEANPKIIPILEQHLKYNKKGN